jgi:hypothetical protein
MTVIVWLKEIRSFRVDFFISDPGWVRSPGASIKKLTTAAGASRPAGAAPAGECAGQSRDYGLRLVEQLAPCDALNRLAGRNEIGVAPAIVLEARPRPVKREAVDLDDQPSFLPGEIDFVTQQANVVARRWKLRATDERAEAFFRLGPREGRARPRSACSFAIPGR